MQLRNVSVILLALLLAAMAMVPYVSANENQDENELREAVETNYVSIDKASDHATFALIEFLNDGALGEKETWLGAAINPNPMRIAKNPA